MEQPEQFLKDAIGLGLNTVVQIEIETPINLQPDLQPQTQTPINLQPDLQPQTKSTIYEFNRLLDENEPIS